MAEGFEEFRASFFVECDELLESLQDGLRELEAGSEDPETINVVFRAVHSIKGGAGAFGLDDLVGFAHVYETALDAVRSGALQITPEIILLFYQCCDMLSDLVRMSRDGETANQDRLKPFVDQLSALVDTSASEDGGAGEEAEPEFEPLALDFGLDADEAPAEEVGEEPVVTTSSPLKRYDIVFQPLPELYLGGNEPLLILRMLTALGDLEVECLFEDLPSLSEYNQALAFLSWRLTLESEVEYSTVAEAFEFADGLCLLTIEEETIAESDSEVVPATEADEDPRPVPDGAPGPLPDARPAESGNMSAPAVASPGNVDTSASGKGAATSADASKKMSRARRLPQRPCAWISIGSNGW